MRSPVPMTPTREFKKLFQAGNARPLALSLILQIVLAFPFGNLYDMRINMAAGYLVGTGQNPYIAQDLSAVFHNDSFRGLSTIGYPPPWTLFLGLIYKCVYAVFPNLILFNGAIKIPIIAANVCLAYLVARVLVNLGTHAAVAVKARNFMLLNPAVLIFSSAWGQIDSLVAFVSLAALVLLDAKKPVGSAILLALAISMKPIMLPFAPAVFVYLLQQGKRNTLWYFSVFFTGCLVFCALPFIVFGWDPAVIFRNWNAHFIVAGCMSFMSISEIWNPHFQLTGAGRFLGMLWAPALLGIFVHFFRLKTTGFKNLLKICATMTLVFFLTRTWLSEPNILVLLPIVLVLVSTGELNRVTLSFFWVFPLGFALLNGSFAALLFPAMPEVMNTVMAFGNEYRFIRLAARTILVIPWLITGWWIVMRLSDKKGFLPNKMGMVTSNITMNG
jgi:hypothetical protein